MREEGDAGEPGRGGGISGLRAGFRFCRTGEEVCQEGDAGEPGWSGGISGLRAAGEDVFHGEEAGGFSGGVREGGGVGVVAVHGARADLRSCREGGAGSSAEGFVRLFIIAGALRPGGDGGEFFPDAKSTPEGFARPAFVPVEILRLRGKGRSGGTAVRVPAGSGFRFGFFLFSQGRFDKSFQVNHTDISGEESVPSD